MSAPVPTGQLYLLHRILISGAVALGGILLLFGVYTYRRSGALPDLALGLFGLVAAAGGLLYLRWFRRKTKGASAS